MKEERGRGRERDPRTARSHVLGMKVASVCSVVEASRKKHLVGKRRCNFPMFFVPTLQYSSYLECFGVGAFFLGFMYLRFGILLILSVLVSVGTNVTGFSYRRCCRRCCRGWYIGVRYVGVDAY